MLNKQNTKVNMFLQSQPYLLKKESKKNNILKNNNNYLCLNSLNAPLATTNITYNGNELKEKGKYENDYIG